MTGKARLAIGLLAAGLALGPCGLRAAQNPGGKEGDGKGKELTAAQAEAARQVQQRLQQFKARSPHVEVISDKALKDALSGYEFVAVRFRQWPVAVAPPPQLKSQNLFAVRKTAAAIDLITLTSADDLEKFFRERLSPIKGEAETKAAVLAYLRLAQELVQDGFYTFEPPSVGKTGGDDNTWYSDGDVKVKPERGNKGLLHAQLNFDKKTGKLAKVTQDNKVVRGMRPRCQATRLLDPDPVIRAICEDALLVMGVAAREYLMEQRAQASPELRRAIDRVWQRILDEGR